MQLEVCKNPEHTMHTLNSIVEFSGVHIINILYMIYKLIIHLSENVNI